jgi:putative transposase
VGIFPLLGVAIHWTTPYAGQSKPIERAFREFGERFAKHPALSGAYVGNKPDAKPENYGHIAVPLAEFLRVVEEQVAAHNARSGRRSVVCNGRSFDEVFAESYVRSPIRKVATAEQRRLWLLAAEGVSVRGDATLTLAIDRRNRYWSDALNEHAGRKCVVRFDPQALHDRVWVYGLDGRFLAEAVCQERAGFNDSMKARDYAKQRNKWRRAQRERLEAERCMDVAEVARMVPQVTASSAPEARVVQPVRTVSQTLRTPTPAPTRMTDEQQKAHEELVAEIAQLKVELIPESQRKKFQRWLRLEQRIQRGEAVSETEQRFWQGFPQTADWRAEKAVFDDFPGYFEVG